MSTSRSSHAPRTSLGVGAALLPALLLAQSCNSELRTNKNDTQETTVSSTLQPPINQTGAMIDAIKRADAIVIGQAEVADGSLTIQTDRSLAGNTTVFGAVDAGEFSQMLTDGSRHVIVLDRDGDRWRVTVDPGSLYLTPLRVVRLLEGGSLEDPKTEIEAIAPLATSETAVVKVLVTPNDLGTTSTVADVLQQVSGPTVAAGDLLTLPAGADWDFANAATTRFWILRRGKDAHTFEALTHGLSLGLAEQSELGWD